MVAIKGHFDGKVIVPDEPVNLPAGQRLIVRIEPADGPVAGGAEGARGIPGQSLVRFAGMIDRRELDAMSAAIEAGCERIDDRDW
ncbi:MAG: hypothetical protein ACJ741_17705 [Pyrinomonadaceae bacterium]